MSSKALKDDTESNYEDFETKIKLLDEFIQEIFGKLPIIPSTAPARIR